jgi:hypothetical protein
MSVSIQSLFTPDEFALELEWLKARDTLLGENCVKRDVKQALELAAASDHPQCQWLISVFAGKTVKNPNEARSVFLAEEKKSPASVCFATLLSRPVDFLLLRHCADMGQPLAQAEMASTSEEKFDFAKSAAGQLERNGFYWLGWSYERGSGCEKDLEKARECFLAAAQLGHVSSMGCLARLLEKSYPRQWFWWGRAAVLGDPNPFLCEFCGPVQEFNSGSGNGAVVFQIGKAMNGHVEKRTIFGRPYNFDKWIGPANSAISFYKSQLVGCRLAVDAWSHVGIRFSVVKDIRVLIGKLIWETRDLALYKV